MPPTVASARPTVVSAAAALLILDAMAGAISVHVLFWLLPANQGLVLPFQPGVWVLALLQVVVALLILRRFNLARWLAVVFFAASVADSLLTTSLVARYQTYPAATVRDGLSYTLQVTAVGLLLLPPSFVWFRSARARVDA